MARKKVVEAAEGAVADLPLPPKNPRLKVFEEIAKKSGGFQPAAQVLRRVRAVPTILPDFDRVSRVGGWPIDRIGLVHGPSGHGKTFLCHALGLSFLRRGHAYCLVDAEMTTPITWCETLLGPYAHDARFMALRPRSYEQAVDAVRATAEAIADANEKGRLERTTCLFVVDSIRKLVPEDIQARIRKEGAEGADGSVDGYGGRAAQYRAALNAAWLDELVPLMHHTGCAILFVGRESEDVNATAQDRRYGKDYRLTGGKSLVFESSLRLRIVRDGWVTEGSGPEARVLGERHRIEMHKTKVANLGEDRVERAHFHTSNGIAAPEGFDRARDVLWVCDRYGLVKRSGSWLSYGRQRWQGEAKFVETVRPETLDEMEAAARERFAEDAKAAEIMNGDHDGGGPGDRGVRDRDG